MMNRTLLILLFTLFFGCSENARPKSLGSFSEYSLWNYDVVLLPEVGIPSKEMDNELKAKSTTVFDAYLIFIRAFGGIAGPDGSKGYFDGAFFFIIDTIYKGSWQSHAVAFGAVDSADINLGGMNGLGTGFFRYRNSYRFYLDGTSIQDSNKITIKKLTDVPIIVPEKE